MPRPPRSLRKDGTCPAAGRLQVRPRSIGEVTSSNAPQRKWRIMRALARRGVSSAEIRTFGSRTTRGTLPPASCVGLGDDEVHRLLLAQFVSKRLVAIQVAFVRKRPRIGASRLSKLPVGLS